MEELVVESESREGGAGVVEGVGLLFGCLN